MEELVKTFTLGEQINAGVCDSVKEVKQQQIVSITFDILNTLLSRGKYLNQHFNRGGGCEMSR